MLRLLGGNIGPVDVKCCVGAQHGDLVLHVRKEVLIARHHLSLQVEGLGQIVFFELEHHSFGDFLGELQRERVLTHALMVDTLFEFVNCESDAEDGLREACHAHVRRGLPELVGPRICEEVRAQVPDESQGQLGGLERLRQVNLNFTGDWLVRRF